MIDIRNIVIAGKTPFLVGVDIVLLIILLLLSKPALNSTKPLPKKNRIMIEILIILFCLFSFWGADWFHYGEFYYSMLEGSYRGHSEPIYKWIADIVPGGYLAFRLVIWGASFILLRDTIRNAHIDYDLSLFLFCGIWLIWFSYARASLAMATAFFGVSLCMRSDRHMVIRVIGLCCVFVALFFHKSSGFIVFIILFCTFSECLSDRFFPFLALVLILFGYFILKSKLSIYLNLDSESDSIIESGVAFGQYYMFEDSYQKGVGEVLANCFERLPYYCLSMISLYAIRNNDKLSAPRVVVVFNKILVCIVLFSSLFLFDLGFTTSVIYTRFVRYAFIPSTISLAYFYRHGICERFNSYLVFFSILGMFYRVLYSLYCSF